MPIPSTVHSTQYVLIIYFSLSFSLSLFLSSLPFTEQTSTVSVMVSIEDSAESSTNSQDYQTFGRGLSLVPLIFILIMAFTTQMVEISLFLGILVGACIMTGSLNEGFKITCSEYLVGALADEGHVYVILFTVILSGAVGMMVGYYVS